MARLHHLIPALIAASAHAGELTLEMKPFFITHSFAATALPEETTSIQLDADAWSDFKIIEIVDHGGSVKKNQPLIVFDAGEIDKKIADTRHSIAGQELSIAQAGLELLTLEKTVPEQLTRLRRNAETAAEELKYFVETKRKTLEESAAQSLKRQEQLLYSYQEELKQLLQMYEADDLTENTEEIILQKQRDAVESAEFALRMETLDHRRTLEVSLPRQHISLTERRDDTALQLDKGQQDLPRSIELKRIELTGLKTALERNRESLSKLEKDRSLFELKAPGDGVFYYGSIDSGKWTTGELIKTLVPQGKPPVHKTLATFIPNKANLIAYAFLDQASARVLVAETQGIAILEGREDVPIPVTLKSLATTPNPDQTYTATFSAEWPESPAMVAGQSLRIQITSYSSEKSLSLPNKAFKFGPKGWTVEVKLADGKTEQRVVTRGRSSEESTEITAGLEAGQVVIVP
ncbi:MAG: hypothetical protein H7Y36_01770 [Armatimonadetes bacterium]|nr:hypothetical protein [Akkermansiaceae bacterium]